MIQQPLVIRASTGNVWADAIVLTLLAAGIPLLVSDTDPLSMNGPFYWPVLAPLVLALRHGFLAGLAGFLALVALQWAAVALSLASLQDPFPLQMMAGYLVVVVLAGELGEYNRRQVYRADKQLHALGDKLRAFRESYFILNASHHRLERRVAVQSLTLNEAVETLQSIFDANPDRPLALSAGEVLDVFVEFAHVQSGAIYGVDDDDHLQPVVLAGVGHPRALNLEDPMIQTCLEHQSLIAIKDLDQQSESAYIVAIPLFDSEGDLHGLITVERIEFFSLNQQTITLMSVLAANVADYLYQTDLNPVLGPEDATRFMSSVRQSQQLEQRYDIAAQLIEIQLEKDTRACREFIAHITNNRRKLERYFQPDETHLLILMETTQEQDAVALISNFEQWSEGVHEVPLAELGIRVSYSTFPLQPEKLSSLVNLSLQNTAMESTAMESTPMESTAMDKT